MKRNEPRASFEANSSSYFRPVFPAIKAHKGQNDNSANRNSVTNDVNERIQRFNHAPVEQIDAACVSARNVDLSNRKRACALMTGHVIERWIRFGILERLSRYTISRYVYAIFVGANKARYRNDRSATNFRGEIDVPLNHSKLRVASNAFIFASFPTFYITSSSNAIWFDDRTVTK